MKNYWLKRNEKKSEILCHGTRGEVPTIAGSCQTISNKDFYCLFGDPERLYASGPKYREPENGRQLLKKQYYEFMVAKRQGLV
jgi:hypothetical protein